MSSYQIIKLKNGEDLICNVLDNENGRLKVSSPLKMETVNRISKKGLTESLALTRWIQPYSDEDHFFIESNSIIIMTPASVGMTRYYEYVLKSYDGLVLKSAKEETVQKIRSEKQKSSKLEIDDDMLESELKDYLFNDKKTIH
mgnify:FL=1|tara:strand:+ start:565 stop:993 length:429 start_codon:yes stop_codon:yes gene_type:complete